MPVHEKAEPSLVPYGQYSHSILQWRHLLSQILEGSEQGLSQEKLGRVVAGLSPHPSLLLFSYLFPVVSSQSPQGPEARYIVNLSEVSVHE